MFWLLAFNLFALSPDPEVQEIEKTYCRAMLESDREKKLASLEKSLELVEQFEKNGKSDLQVDLCWIAAKGELAQLKSKLTALHYLKPLREKAQALGEKAPGYYHAAPFRILGRLYQLAPPFISYGSKSEAEKNYREAMRLDPDFPGNQAFYADFLFQQGKVDEARKLALRVSQSKNLDEFPCEKGEWMKIIQPILAKP